MGLQAQARLSWRKLAGERRLATQCDGFDGQLQVVQKAGVRDGDQADGKQGIYFPNGTFTKSRQKWGESDV